MNNWLKQGLDYELEELKRNLKMIALKQKEEEWKRDHYRHAVTISLQRIYRLLNSTITADQPAAVSKPTKDELKVLKDMIEEMIRL